ncbi:MAG: chromate transporter [Alphaproteobacteria bacterium]|jgi:chromate transporter
MANDNGGAPPGGNSVVSLADAVRVWLKIGLLSFGGPAGQIALMHRLLVDEKKWISEGRFLHALNYCMLLPGPEAQQLATYVGWLLHRTLGGLIAGILFVLPGAVVILVLSILYAGFRDLSFVQALFFGIKAAVLAVVVQAVLRIGQRALKNAFMVTIAGLAFVGIFFFAAPFPVIVILAALAGFTAQKLRPSLIPAGAGRHGSEDADEEEAEAPPHTRPSTIRSIKIITVCGVLWFTPIIALALLLGPDNVFTQESLFFSKMAVVTFGGAYAVLAYVAQQAVSTYGWLAPGEMLDGLGMAETTPGPLIMVVQFVGFMGAYRNPGMLDPMLAGVLGAALTTWVTFVPCFLWIFLGGPYIEALRGNKALSAALGAVTAAVVGVILNLAIWFALHVLFGEIEILRVGLLRLQIPVWETLDIGALALAAGAMIAVLRFGVPMIPTLGVSALAGIAIFYAGTMG